MKKLLVICFFIVGIVTSVNSQCSKQCNKPCEKKYTKATLDIPIRDPFILADNSTKTYYMYAQTGNRIPKQKGLAGVEVYKSKDLKLWSEPSTVLSLPEDHWGGISVWAPEVHKYKNKYYLFTTLTAKDTVPWREPGERMYPNKRATEIFWSDSPEGPFKSFNNSAQTPSDWMSLDGTLFIEDGIPYMVFCHEWIQIIDGTMEIVQLSEDLSKPVGEPQTLFKATDAPWVRSLKDAGGQWHGYITDGPSFHRLESGKLLMIWSSFGEERYAVGMAVSESGSVKGPWKQLPEPLFKKDGGHGMLFKTFEGQMMLTIHQPNGNGLERARFFKVKEEGDKLVLVK